MARKPGYLPLENGEPGTQVELGTSSDITISLMPEALIIGTSTCPPMTVWRKFKWKSTGAKCRKAARIGSAGGTPARANGDFRFANLRKGDYKVFTNELLDRDLMTFDPRGQLYGYPPVYYPRR